MKEQLPSNPLYYMQSTGHTGNSLLWWRKGKHGYTNNISEAHVFTLEEALSQHRCRPDVDTPWRKDYIDARTQPHVVAGHINKMEEVDFAVTAHEPKSDTTRLITLSGNELVSAFEFLGGDPNTDISIGWFEATKDAETGEDMPAGHYIFCSEYPEEGRELLSDKPRAVQPPSPGAENDPLVVWVLERLENCQEIATKKTGDDRAGWLDDAQQFAAILRRLSTTVPPVVGWRPIDTAPSELGTRVLGYVSAPEDRWPYHRCVCVTWLGDVLGWSMPGISGLTLSHWRPIPDDPCTTVTKSEGRGDG